MEPRNLPPGRVVSERLVAYEYSSQPGQANTRPLSRRYP
jgi:hypothetical protein